jgi:hypothetical protein
MWKKIGFAVALIFAWAVLGQAQENGEKGPNKLYVHIGIASPMAPTDFQNGWTTGANVGLAYSKDWRGNFALIGSVDFNNFDFDGHSYSEFLNAPKDLMDVDGKTSFSMGASAGLKWSFSRGKASGAVPYLLAAVGGNYFCRGKVVAAYTEKNDIQPGFSGFYPAFTVALGSDVYIEEEDLFVEPGVQVLLTPTTHTNFWYVKVGMGIHLF